MINKITNIQSEFVKDDIYGNLSLNSFLGGLNLIKYQFEFALAPNDPVQLGKPGLLKMIGKGLLSGLLLCFVILLGMVAWKNIKNS